ncbi:MAG: TorF family putative porin [Halothiobacillaceae bacterium]
MSKRILTRSVLASAVAGASFLATAPAMAEFEITGNMTLASDYFVRGFTQTDNKPAIQGGADLTHSSGLYAGVWGSSVGADVNTKGIEIDFYGGYALTLGDELDLDFGGIYYMYPSESVLKNTVELYAGANWKWFSLYYYHAVTDFFGDDGKNSYYLNLGASVPITGQLSAFGSVGYQKVKVSAGPDNDYTDWSIGMDYVITDTWSVAGSVIGVDDDDQDTRFVASLNASF